MRIYIAWQTCQQLDFSVVVILVGIELHITVILFLFIFNANEGWPISKCLQVFCIFISLMCVLKLFFTYWFEYLPFIDSWGVLYIVWIWARCQLLEMSTHSVSQWLSFHSLNSSSVWAEVLNFNAFKFINYFLYSFCFFCQFKTFFTTQMSWSYSPLLVYSFSFAL